MILVSNYKLVICGLQARLREAASLEKHVLLKKLRDALESLKGRVAGRNKDDVEEAISMVSFLYHALFFRICSFEHSYATYQTFYLVT
jgi:hypothetical protein